MKKIFYCLVAALVLAACVKEDASIAKVEELKNPYAVTPDEAVQLLKSVMGGESTRAVSVGEIKTLRKSDFVPTTRGGEDGDVIYIVDLENGGSAVMGADKRMEPIYAILDETKISAEQLISSATRSTELSNSIEDFVVGALNGAIQVDLMAAGDLLLPEMPIVPVPRYVTVTTNLGSRSPLLETKWGWAAPYDNVYGSGTDSEDNAIVAIAQLFYYHRQPNSLGSYTFDWDLIAECEYGQTPSVAAQNEVAKLFYAISQNGVGAISASHPNVRVILLNNGFTPDYFSSRDISQIKGQIDQNKLVIGYGEGAGNLSKYWLFDGYKFYREDVYYRVYDPMGSGTYTDTLESSTTYNLCHCNFGYQGVCDGYYPKNVFDLTSRLASKNRESLYGDVAGTMEDVILTHDLYTLLY